MSSLTKLEFLVLDINDDNYLSWVLNVEIHLDVMILKEKIKKGNMTSSQENVKPMIFLQRHLHAKLKIEYLMVKDPYKLWQSLKEMYDHKIKNLILPKARYNLMHLKL